MPARIRHQQREDESAEEFDRYLEETKNLEFWQQDKHAKEDFDIAIDLKEKFFWTRVNTKKFWFPRRWWAYIQLFLYMVKMTKIAGRP